MKRNLFWGLLGLMLTLLGFSNATGPPLTAVAPHETVSMTTAVGTIAPANGNAYQEGPVLTGRFNAAAPLDTDAVGFIMNAPDSDYTAEPVAVLMNYPTSGYHNTGGPLRIDKPDDVAEPLYAFTVRRDNDRSVVRLN